MIEELDRSLERWLRADADLPKGAADVRFDQPERDWSSRRSVPMVSLFLYSVMPSASRAVAGDELVTNEQGAPIRQRRAPVMSARYLVSVWGGGPEVEHELLGRLVHLMASNPYLADEHLGESLRQMVPRPTVSLSPDDATTMTSLWTSLAVPPRPAIQMLVRTPVGQPSVLSTAPTPSSIELTSHERYGTAAMSTRRRRLVTAADGPRTRSGAVQEFGSGDG